MAATPVNCRFTAHRDGHTYDLAPLRRISTDYFARNNDLSDQFYLNVCGPTIDPKCAPAGACLTDRFNPDSWTPIGDPTTTQFDVAPAPAGSLTTVQLRMESPKADCPTTGGKRSVELSATCNRYPNGTTVPEQRLHFDAQDDGCKYKFAMVSRFACPVDGTGAGTGGGDGSSGSGGAADDGTCTILGGRYSLKPLRSETSNYRIETTLDTFWLNVCGPLATSQTDGSAGCPTGAAVCALAKDEAQSRKRNLGSKGVLTLEDNVLTLTFADGEVCADGAPRSTVVRFPCTSRLTGDNGGARVVQGHTACGKTIFEFPSRAGCDVATLGAGAGTILGWIIFALLLAYFFGRLAYNRLVLRQPGLEAVPHIDAAIEAIEWARAKWRGVGRIQI